MSSQMRLSADGMYYWDGRQWVTTLSADGRSRWDGVRWVPLPPPAAASPVYAPVYAPMYVPAPAPKPRRAPTSWTRPLQITLAVAFGLYGLYSLSTPLWLAGPMQQYMRQTALQQAQQAPEIYPNPNQYADMMGTFAYVGVAIGVIIGVAIVVVALIGTLKRWTWMYYALMVLLGLQILALPFQAATAFGLVNTASSSLPLPPAITWFGIGWGLVSAGLVAWMLIALLTRGPWAMKKELAGE